MGIFDFMRSNPVATGSGIAGAVGGIATGAGITHAAHKLTTGKRLKRAEKRLGGSEDSAAQNRAVMKIAILRTLAQRDGVFCEKEQVFLYRYILESSVLPADKKVELALDLSEKPPSKITEFWQAIRKNFGFSDIFESTEEAAGFVLTMFCMTKVDGEIHKDEISYLKEICEACNISKNLYEDYLNEPC
jgi:hypothetical protein